MACFESLLYKVGGKTANKIRAIAIFLSFKVHTTDQKHYVEDATGRMAFPSGKHEFGKKEPLTRWDQLI
jgi:hypothetical protein